MMPMICKADCVVVYMKDHIWRHCCTCPGRTRWIRKNLHTGQSIGLKQDRSKMTALADVIPEEIIVNTRQFFMIFYYALLENRRKQMFVLVAVS